MMVREFGAPILVLDQFVEVHRRGIAMLRSLDAPDWSRPTVCAGWNVHDVALHLTGGMLANVSRRRDGHAGNFAEFTPEGVSADDPEWLVRTLNAWNEAWVVAARRLSPKVTVDLLDMALGQLIEYFATVDMMATGDAIGWAGPDPAPVWLDVAREYTEVWSHLAQIREATGRDLVDDPALLAPVLSVFMHGVPRALADIERPDGTALRIEITGDAGGEWWFVRDGTTWAQRKADGADATVTIRDVDAWRLATKGIEPDLARERMRMEGDRALGEGFLNLVAILG